MNKETIAQISIWLGAFAGVWAWFYIYHVLPWVAGHFEWWYVPALLSMFGLAFIVFIFTVAIVAWVLSRLTGTKI